DPAEDHPFHGPHGRSAAHLVLHGPDPGAHGDSRHGARARDVRLPGTPDGRPHREPGVSEGARGCEGWRGCRIPEEPRADAAEIPRRDPIQVQGAKGVHAVEVETTEVVERYRNSIRGRVKEFLKWADIPLDAKPFIEIATTNPAFEESAMFDRMVDYILKEGEAYDRVIFDTAAVANAVRLIGLSKIYGLWLTRMIDS